MKWIRWRNELEKNFISKTSSLELFYLNILIFQEVRIFIFIFWYNYKLLNFPW